MRCNIFRMKNDMKKYIITVMMVLVAVVMNAQDVLTIDSCFALAKANNAELKTKRLDIQRAQEVKAQAFTKYFPQISGAVIGYAAANPLLRFGVDDISNADVRFLIQSIVDFFEPATGFDGEFKFLDNGVTAGVVVGQPVFMGGRIVNGNKLAKVGVNAAELNAEVTEREVLENIETTYYLVVGLQQKVKTIDNALALLDTLDRVVQVSLKAGLITSNDALRVSLERNKLNAQQLQLNNGIHLASMLLCQQIGIELPENGLSLEFEKEADKTETNPNFVRPEVELLDLQIQAEKLRKKMTLGESLPNVIVGGIGYYGNLVNKRFMANAFAFARLSIPLTQWWETSHKLKEHKIKIDMYEIDKQNLTEKMSIQEQQAYNNMIEAEVLLKSDSAAYDMARDNYRIASINYSAGLNTISDVLEANTLLLQADNAIIDRNISLISSRRRYHDLTGK